MPAICVTSVTVLRLSTKVLPAETVLQGNIIGPLKRYTLPIQAKMECFKTGLM